MKKRWQKVLLVGCFLVLALAIAIVWLGQSRPRGEGEGYTLAAVEWGTMSETVGATGRLQPQEVIVVSSPLSGQVVEVYPDADINKIVHEGQPLLRLDDRLARQKLAQAEATVRMARTDCVRAEAARDAALIELLHAVELDEKQLAPGRSVELAQCQLRVAESNVEAARAKAAEAQAVREQAALGVELTVVRVPDMAQSSGGTSLSKRSYTVLDRKVVLGQLVAPPESAQLFTLAADLAALRVHAQINEDDVGKISPGLPATFRIHTDTEEEASFAGRVTEIRPLPSHLQGAVFYDACIDIDNKRSPRTHEWLLRPGMTVSVTIIQRTHPGVWKLPVAALDIQPDKQDLTGAANAKLARWQDIDRTQQWKLVWVLNADGKPWPIFVRTGGENVAGEAGIANGQYLEILEWDPELEPKPDPKEPATHPRVITGTPPGQQPGLFDHPNLKIF
jgi:HlyD family secretion protein